MAKTSRGWGDRDAEKAIAILLRAGVAISASVVLLGTVFYLARHGGAPVEFRVFHGEPAQSRRLGDVVRDAAELRSRGVLQLGVVLLIATPVLRVAFSVAAFIAERDWMYVAFTMIVLGNPPLQLVRALRMRARSLGNCPTSTGGVGSLNPRCARRRRRSRGGPPPA